MSIWGSACFVALFGLMPLGWHLSSIASALRDIARALEKKQ